MKKRVKKLKDIKQLRNHINNLPDIPEYSDLKSIANTLLDEIEHLYRLVAITRSDYVRVQAIEKINNIKKDYIKLLQDFSILPTRDNKEYMINIRDKTKEDLMIKLNNLDNNTRKALLEFLYKS